MGIGGGGSNQAAQQAQIDEWKRQARIRQGTKRIDEIFNGQFNDSFFNGRRQAYIDYATPQLDQQFGDAKKELTYALARNGTLDSSIRGAKAAELQRLYDIQKQSVADQALASETETRNATEGARQDLIGMLNATGDSQTAVNSALARSTALSQAPAYSPLAAMFGDFTNTLGARAAAERANYYTSGGAAGSGASLFGNSGSSVRVR